MSYKFITSLNSDARKTLNYEKLQHLLEAILGQAAGVAEVGGFGFPILEAAVVVELHVVRQHIKELAPLNKKAAVGASSARKVLRRLQSSVQNGIGMKPEFIGLAAQETAGFYH